MWLTVDSGQTGGLYKYHAGCQLCCSSKASLLQWQHLPRHKNINLTWDHYQILKHITWFGSLPYISYCDWTLTGCIDFVNDCLYVGKKAHEALRAINGTKGMKTNNALTHTHTQRAAVPYFSIGFHCRCLWFYKTGPCFMKMATWR